MLTARAQRHALPFLALPILTIVLAVACLLAIGTGSARAQVWGVWSNPAPTASGSWYASGHFLAGDLVGLMGQVRTGLGEQADLGVQIGIPDFDTDFAVAGDVRYLALPSSESLPLDLAVDGAVGWFKIGGPSDATQLDIDFGAIVSSPIDLENGMGLVPYGSFVIAIAHRSIDVPKGVVVPQGVSTSDTTTDAHFRGGVDLAVNEQLSVNGELNVSTRDSAIYVSFGGGYHF